MALKKNRHRRGVGRRLLAVLGERAKKSVCFYR
ncbi:hypothetical protein [Streptococcus himalayensis]|nr:hypothetical protein [Streptococcus himalayensis]